MQKQLNPQLFGIQTTPRGVTPNFQSEESLAQPLIHKRLDSPQMDYARDDKAAQMQKQIQEVHGQLAQLAFQTEEALKTIRMKGDRQQLMLNKVERDQEALGIETSQKIHFLQQKHMEQKKLEENIQSLIDRQNNLLKGYEVRLNQMQKLLAEKEAQLLSTMSALNDTKMELQRLKRL